MSRQALRYAVVATYHLKCESEVMHDVSNWSCTKWVTCSFHSLA